MRTKPMLTPAQLRILQLVADGWARTKIAARFKIHVRTVDAHMKQMYNRASLVCNGRSCAPALVAWAMRNELIH